MSDEVGGVVPSAWRQEAVLVLRRRAALPDLCFRCGRPAGGGVLAITLRWHTPMLYLLLLQPVIYLIVARLAGHGHPVRLPLCARHRRGRWMGLLGGGLLMIVGTGGAVAGVVSNSVALALGGGYLALAGLLAAVLLGTAGRVIHVDEHFARMRGADLALLDALPDWDAYDEPAERTA